MFPEESLISLFAKYRLLFLLLLVGTLLLGLGIFLAKVGNILSPTKIEVLNATTEGQAGVSEIVVEVSGEVEKPGVYKLSFGSRVEDGLVAAGGLGKNADRVWVEKTLNRAAKLTDGQKIFIPSLNEQSKVLSANNFSVYQTTSANISGQGSGLVNINNSTLKELDSLPGIGPVYGQNIIDHRPYSNVDELLSKSVLKASVFEKIKDLITVY